MNRSGRALMMLFWGMMIGRLLWSGGIGWFVVLWWPMIAASVSLVVVGLYEAWNAWQEEKADPESMTRWRGPSIGWLLALPMLVLVSVEPTALGASAADRVDAYTPDTGIEFDPIVEVDGVAEMRVFDFLNRAIWDEDRSLEGRTVRLEGLVVNDADHTEGFTLTRFLVACCAADGVPLQVDLYDVGGSYENDTWVIVDVEWIVPDRPYSDLPSEERRVAASVKMLTVETDAVNDPYESPY